MEEASPLEAQLIQQMKEIVSTSGEPAPSEPILKGFLTAAKGDLNVALDHYFNSCSTVATSHTTQEIGIHI